MEGFNFSSNFRLISEDIKVIDDILAENSFAVNSCCFELDAVGNCELIIRLKNEKIRQQLSKYEYQNSKTHFFSAQRFENVNDEENEEVEGSILFTDSTLLKDVFMQVFAEFNIKCHYEIAVSDYNEISPIVTGADFSVLKNILQGLSNVNEDHFTLQYKHICIKVYKGYNNMAFIEDKIDILTETIVDHQYVPYEKDFDVLRYIKENVQTETINETEEE